MNRQEKFQEQLQNPKWCEKQVKCLFSKGSKKFSLFFFCDALLLHSLIPPISSVGDIINPDTSTSMFGVFDVAVYIIMILADLMFLFLFFYSYLLKYNKRWKQMDLWGDRQKIYQLICREFLDKDHPPKKSIPLWTTSHFILFSPKITPKLYYLPLLTERIWTPKEGDVIYFSDGKKIGLTGMPIESLILIEEAIKDFLPENEEEP